MRGDLVFEILGSVDPRFILEADPSGAGAPIAAAPSDTAPRSPKGRRPHSGWVAAAVCAIVALGVYLGAMWLGQGRWEPPAVTTEGTETAETTVTDPEETVGETIDETTEAEEESATEAETQRDNDGRTPLPEALQYTIEEINGKSYLKFHDGSGCDEDPTGDSTSRSPWAGRGLCPDYGDYEYLNYETVEDMQYAFVIGKHFPKTYEYLWYCIDGSRGDPSELPDYTTMYIPNTPFPFRDDYGVQWWQSAEPRYSFEFYPYIFVVCDEGYYEEQLSMHTPGAFLFYDSTDLNSFETTYAGIPCTATTCTYLGGQYISLYFELSDPENEKELTVVLRYTAENKDIPSLTSRIPYEIHVFGQQYGQHFVYSDHEPLVAPDEAYLRGFGLSPLYMADDPPEEPNDLKLIMPQPVSYGSQVIVSKPLSFDDPYDMVYYLNNQLLTEDEIQKLKTQYKQTADGILLPNLVGLPVPTSTEPFTYAEATLNADGTWEGRLAFDSCSATFSTYRDGNGSLRMLESLLDSFLLHDAYLYESVTPFKGTYGGLPCYAYEIKKKSSITYDLLYIIPLPAEQGTGYAICRYSKSLTRPQDPLSDENKVPSGGQMWILGISPAGVPFQYDLQGLTSSPSTEFLIGLNAEALHE